MDLIRAIEEIVRREVKAELGRMLGKTGRTSEDKPLRTPAAKPTRKAKKAKKGPSTVYVVGQKGQLPAWLKAQGVKDSDAAKKGWDLGTKIHKDQPLPPGKQNGKPVEAKPPTVVKPDTKAAVDAAMAAGKK